MGNASTISAIEAAVRGGGVNRPRRDRARDDEGAGERGEGSERDALRHRKCLVEVLGTSESVSAEHSSAEPTHAFSADRIRIRRL